MRIPPLASAVAAGIAVMWAALLALQYAAPYLPPLPSMLGWIATAAGTTLAMVPALIVAAKAYRRVPPIRVEADHPLPDDGTQGTDAA